jgi:hypothetical protein
MFRMSASSILARLFCFLEGPPVALLAALFNHTQPGCDCRVSSIARKKHGGTPQELVHLSYKTFHVSSSLCLCSYIFPFSAAYNGRSLVRLNSDLEGAVRLAEPIGPCSNCIQRSDAAVEFRLSRGSEGRNAAMLQPTRS